MIAQAVSLTVKPSVSAGIFQLLNEFYLYNGRMIRAKIIRNQAKIAKNRKDSYRNKARRVQ